MHFEINKSTKKKMEKYKTTKIFLYFSIFDVLIFMRFLQNKKN